MEKQDYLAHIPDLQELFLASFGKAIPADFLRWRFTENIFGKTFANVIKQESKIVAHYASTPLHFINDSKKIDAAHTGTVMTHPSCQGQGFFLELAKEHDALLKQENFQFLITFPNPNRPTDRFFIHKLDWFPVYEIPTLALDLTSLKSVRGFSAEDLSFDNEFDLYDYDSQKDQLGLINTYRSKSYLKWRYARNPINQYQNMVVGDGNKILSFAVFKIYTINKKKYLDLVDFGPYDNDAFGFLLENLISYALKMDCVGIKTWAPRHHDSHYVLSKRGFKHELPITYFTVKTLNSSLTSRLKCFSNWWITMGDSDIY